MTPMLTVSGRLVDPVNVAPADVCLHDAAHALSHICRYGGHTYVPYSVAAHSLLACSVVCAAIVRHLVRPTGMHHVFPVGTSVQGLVNTALLALLHDAGEAYVGDMVAPLKHHPGFAGATEYQRVSVNAQQAAELALLPHYAEDAPRGELVDRVERGVVVRYEMEALLPAERREFASSPFRTAAADRGVCRSVHNVGGLFGSAAAEHFCATYGRLRAEVWVEPIAARDDLHYNVLPSERYRKALALWFVAVAREAVRGFPNPRFDFPHVE